MPYSLFSTIPPERVGVDGEYDHSGLAKRVALAFQNQLPASEINSLRVAQRGRVVLLIGDVSSRQTLVHLVDIALGIEGAADVETHGLRVRDWDE
jgi:hypothetical protein